MALGVVGTKRGMSRVLTEDGVSIPVTVVEIEPNRVTQVKTLEIDGYRAVQVTTGTRNNRKINKPSAGLYAKAETGAGVGLWEFRLDEGEGEDMLPGNEVRVDLFTLGQKIDISGTTKGKGFAGVVKRHHFATGDATHGNSLAHRVAGSIGQCQTPGRVFKGKRMAGQMGNVTRSAIGLEIVRVDADRNLMLVKGAVPGAKGGSVVVLPSRRK